MLVQDKVRAAPDPTVEARVDGKRKLRISIYADGADPSEMVQLYQQGIVQGFTTNPTLMRKAGVADYEAFAKSVLAQIPDLPISLEVLADDFPEMERQARLISSWGPNVFVKIPVTNTKGESSLPLVHRLQQVKVKLNITAILLVEQVLHVAEALSHDVPAIVSVFAGRIADTGRNPVPIMGEAAGVLRDNPNASLLWASPREVLNVYQAEQCGCAIITVTRPVLAKLRMRAMDLRELSCETVQMFYDDACRAGYSI